MRAWQTRRRPKIAAAFCEPNSPHCRGKNIIGLRAQPALVNQAILEIPRLRSE